MRQLKSNAITGKLLPQKVNYSIKHEEEIEEMIDKYIKNDCNLKVNYDNEANPIFVKKEK